jgi:hypothetical protein
VRERFVAAACGKAPAADVLAARRGAAPGAFAATATRALPRGIASFTGRQPELARLLGAIDILVAGGGVVGIHAIDGMAGIGKPIPGGECKIHMRESRHVATKITRRRARARPLSGAR